MGFLRGKIPLITELIAADVKLRFALSLADHHGCWRAWCFRYINFRGDLEGHHVWPRQKVYDLLPTTHFPRDCIIPVHRNICHRQFIQGPSDTAGRYLAEAPQQATEEIDSTCLRSFLEGDLNRAIFLREWRRRKCEELGDRAAIRENLVFELNPLAGSVLGRQLIEKQPPWLNGKISEDDSVCDPEILVAAGNVLVNSGFIKAGWSRYQELEVAVDRWRKATDKRYGIIKRRVAVVTGEARDSNDALSFAFTTRDKYTIRTALLCLGWAQFRAGHFGIARNTFDRIESEIVGPTSWWHITCKEFGIGCAMYWEQTSNRDLQSILSRLLRAQYLNAFFGLQGIPVPDPRRDGGYGEPIVVTPTDMIRWIASSHDGLMQRRCMTDLRAAALRFLRDEVIETLRRPNVKSQSR